RERALLLRRDAEAAELEPRRALADPEVEPAVGDEVEHAEPFRRPCGMVVARDDLPDAVAEANAPRARGRGGEEHLRRRAMRVLLEEMVLDTPRVVVAEAVGELDLLEGLADDTALGLRIPG